MCLNSHADVVGKGRGEKRASTPGCSLFELDDRGCKLAAGMAVKFNVMRALGQGAIGGCIAAAIGVAAGMGLDTVRQMKEMSRKTELLKFSGPEMGQLDVGMQEAFLAFATVKGGDHKVLQRCMRRVVNVGVARARIAASDPARIQPALKTEATKMCVSALDILHKFFVAAGVPLTDPTISGDYSGEAASAIAATYLQPLNLDLRTAHAYIVAHLEGQLNAIFLLVDEKMVEAAATAPPLTLTAA